ncbi:MAG: S8 family serine peptidase [Bacteroidales bacterium]|jgi:serine protease AprX|nr:S8 family serine peptidase [Bacteroidales bacterium]MDI9592594.1 S8 family serine peptidase [Bacteroidota bacterium]HNY58752.1 S8 family serine peptidase [Bacteroidales bacterium]HOF80834.1 S8 family serine peptidase [Bacteroidales bacterium]HOG65870.1 S8 family serine peptidase [Bacteroidales bacterium]
MKSLLVTILALFSFTCLYSQIYPDKYFVAFTDKNNSPYSIENPQEYLSARAIERRSRYNIPIDIHDLPVNPQYIEAVADIGVQVINPTKWLNGITIYTNDPSLLSEIEALPFVKSVRKARQATQAHPKTDFDDDISLFKPSWENETIIDFSNRTKATGKSTSLQYGLGYNQINQINGIPLHDDGFQGQGMVIAVLDAGFSYANQLNAFDSLYMNGLIYGTRDIVSGGTNVYQGSFHGTGVLSTMGANLPGELIGTAPKAGYYLIRTEDTGSEYLIEEYNWASGAEFADSTGADIINSSLGYVDFDDPNQNHIYQDMDGNTAPATIAADRAMSRGMIVVNSAGNSGNYTSWPWIGAPADGDSVFTIGAVDANGIIAGFSSIGPTADGRLKPNVVAQGAATVIASSNGGTTTSNGTSFSSPIIAGMTACLWQINQELANMSILEAIQQSGSYYNNPNYQYGNGIPDYNQARMVLSAQNKGIALTPESIKVIPNPFFDKIGILFNAIDSQLVTIRMFDITGRLIVSGKFDVQRVGLNYLELTQLDFIKPGIYTLTVIAGEKRLNSQKIVKVKD